MGLEDWLGNDFISTRVKDLLAWGRKNSLWPMPFGTACCAIERRATGKPKRSLTSGSSVTRESATGSVSLKISKASRRTVPRRRSSSLSAAPHSGSARPRVAAVSAV